jgi:hypothetical protein
MSSSRQTWLLGVLAIVAAVACALATRAADALRDNATARSQLAELSARSGGVLAASGDGIPQGEELNRRLRDAANAAAVAEKLVSIEPGEINRRPETDEQEMLVFLRLETLTMNELVAFLHRLDAADASSRTRTIELSSADSAGAEVDAANPREAWHADVTLSFVR